MKETFGSKVKRFWNRHKGDVIVYTLGIGALAAFGIYVNHHEQKKAEEKQREELKSNIETAIQSTLKKAEDGYELEASKPENQLSCGGYILPENDNLYEPDYPNALANNVPLSQMGEFGQEIMIRLNNEYPDWEEVGFFNPKEAVADVLIDFGHEIWKLRNPEEAEKTATDGTEEAA